MSRNSGRQWQAEDDLRTLINAEKIKADKARLAAAMKKHKEQMKALEAIRNKQKGA